MRKSLTMSELGPEPEVFTPEWVEWKVRKAVKEYPSLNTEEDVARLRLRYQDAKAQEERVERVMAKFEAAEAEVDRAGMLRIYR